MEIIQFFQTIKIPMTVAHVIAVVFGMGGALMSDLLFSFFSKAKKLNDTQISTLSILSKVVLFGLIVIILSGMAIFLSDPVKYMNSAKFLAKMSILLILLINGYVLNKVVWPHVSSQEFFISKKSKLRQLAFACGAISVISWLSTCTLGVLNRVSLSYFNIMSIYLIILLFGITIALLVEKKEFR